MPCLCNCCMSLNHSLYGCVRFWCSTKYRFVEPNYSFWSYWVVHCVSFKLVGESSYVAFWVIIALTWDVNQVDFARFVLADWHARHACLHATSVARHPRSLRLVVQVPS